MKVIFFAVLERLPSGRYLVGFYPNSPNGDYISGISCATRDEAIKALDDAGYRKIAPVNRFFDPVAGQFSGEISKRFRDADGVPTIEAEFARW